MSRAAAETDRICYVVTVEVVERPRIEGIFVIFDLASTLDKHRLFRSLVEALRRLPWSFPADSTCGQEAALLPTIDHTSVTTWKLAGLTKKDIGRKKQKRNIHGDEAKMHKTADKKETHTDGLYLY